MYAGFSIKKYNLSATIVAVLLFATGGSARAAGTSERAIEKPHAARLDQPNGATPLPVDLVPREVTVGEIEIPAVGNTTRVLEGDDAGILRLSVGHIPGTAVPGPSGNVGLAGHNNIFIRPLRT